MGDRRFDGRVAIVTGAGRGSAAPSPSGSRRTARRSRSRISTMPPRPTVAGDRGGRWSGHRDPRRRDAAGRRRARWPRRRRSAFGRIDILVNNAGILRSTRAAEVVARGVAPRRRRQPDRVVPVRPGAPIRRCATSGHGRIVNIASMAGRATSTLGGVHYTTAKAGVLGLTRHLAREWARDGITVNAISPGIVDTPMVRASTDDGADGQVLASIPFGRLAEPSEIAVAGLLPRVRRGGVHHRRQRRHPRRRADHRLTTRPRLRRAGAPRITTDGPGSGGRASHRRGQVGDVLDALGGNAERSGERHEVRIDEVGGDTLGRAA